MCRMYSPVVNFNAPLNTQFVRLIMSYLCLPTVGPYWLRFGAQTSQSALGKKKEGWRRTHCPTDLLSVQHALVTGTVVRVMIGKIAAGRLRFFGH